VLALVLYCVTKPVHVDDANFLRLAEGAAQDPWRPYDITINWLGTTDRAFNVLSNPPGIGYWLAPVRHAPEWAMHLWMTPWLALALFGTARLARVLGIAEERAILILGTSPVFVLAAQSLNPDLPLTACAIAGIAGFLAGGRWAAAWAALAGASVFFKYSGLCVLPLVVLAGFQRGRVRQSLPVVLPALLLFAHDLLAYGQVHAFAMAEFQGRNGESYQWALLFRKAVAALAMLGGACLLPVLPWRLGALPFAAAGALLGVAAGVYSHHDAAQLAATVGCSAAGGLALGSLAVRTPDDRFLAVWLLGGYAFLLTLMFAATRYWLLFAPAIVLAALRRNPSDARVGVAVAVSAALSFALAHDDDAFARGYRDAARELTQRYPDGLFIGHWGWQYYLEQGGWHAAELYQSVPSRLAVAFAPWPQQFDHNECLKREPARVLQSSWPIRAYSMAGAANFHSFLISTRPPLETYAPWTIATDPYDQVVLIWRCEALPPEIR